MRDRIAEIDLALRPYRDVDESEVLELIRGSLGEGPAGQRSPEYFRWKHLENPFGRSYMIVAESNGQIIGFRALMRWRFLVGGRTIEAVRPVDTVTHPQHRGRGVFSALTRTALDELRGQVDLVFNTPNVNSLPGYVKMGWHIVGRIPIRIRICRPARFASWKLRHIRRDAPQTEKPSVGAPTAADALADESAVAQLVDRAEISPWGYSTPRSVDYLRWRFGEAPQLGYHAVSEAQAGELIGMTLFRLRPDGPLWGLSVGDVIVRGGDINVARRLLRAARRAADVSYVAATFPRDTAAARVFRGPMTLAPGGMTLVVNALRPDLDPDPMRLSSWALTVGELEVF